MSMNPIDVVKAILPQLNDKEKAEVAAMCGTSVCASQGHRIKTTKLAPKNWMEQPKTLLYCERCNHKEFI